MPNGKLIVIDGVDGSGKATQTRLLVSRLRKEGKKVKFADFPRYGEKSAGPLEEYLEGRYGSAQELGAYIPSMFFAVDRFAASKRIREDLSKGFTVVANRYVTANMAHQGGKIKSLNHRQKYFKWLDDLEYNIFKIPKPDLVIILHLPPKISLRLIKKRGKQDLHERDLKHLVAAEKAYLQMAKKFKYPVVEGFVNGKLLSPQEVNDKIYGIIRSRD